MPKKEPSVNEVLAFTRPLIPQIYLDHILNTLGSRIWFWWDLLHEVSHYAVKSDPYIEYWWKNGRPEKVPNMNWSYRNGVLVPDRYPDWNQNDHTPCEWGSRAWQRLALDLNDWINPAQSPEWSKYQERKEKERHWMEIGNSYHDHPVSKNPFEQLKVVGIDFKRGRDDLRYLRPTKPVVPIGWRPMLGWRFDQSA